MANDEARKLGSGFGPVVSGSAFGRVLSKRYTMFYHDVIEDVLAKTMAYPLKTILYLKFNSKWIKQAGKELITV
jgi:hypothetical protein